MSVVNVGLIGAGTVGCGVIKILNQNKEIIIVKFLKKWPDLYQNKGYLT